MFTKAIIVIAGAVTTFCVAHSAHTTPSQPNRPSDQVAVGQPVTAGKVDLHAALGMFKSARHQLSSAVEPTN